MSALHFLLNDREIETDAHPATLVLDFVRDLVGIKGTKEGCREGDCGACVVLIGEVTPGGLRYRSVTSCLVPIGSLQGKHLVTIEGLNGPDLSPVQEAIVEEGGSQCGFCTAGIVVSLTGSVIQHGGDLGAVEVKDALGGHLCRCTGYRSLKAGRALINDRIGPLKGVQALADSGAIPLYFKNIEHRLRSMAPALSVNGAERVAHRIAGGTDIYVQRGDDLPDSQVAVLDLDPRFAGVVDRGEWIDVGAGTTFEDFSRDPVIQQIVPEIVRYMQLIASIQIRNRATLGGNVVNASPIGDMTVLLLALQSELVLESSDGRRRVPMTTFYKGYKKMDMRPGEVLTRILIPRLEAGARVAWEKVSKRKTLDIATVNFSMVVTVADGVVERASAAVGGVAPVPLYLAETSRYLTGRDLNRETVLGADEVMQGEIAPISDIRGSADYKRLLARQLLIASMTDAFPEALPVAELL